MTQGDEIVDLREETADERPHRVTLFEREELEIVGVLQVDTFDDREIVLQTEMGMLTLRGEDLHIEQLDLEEGIFRCSGLIVGMQYTPQTGSRASRATSLWDRIFH